MLKKGLITEIITWLLVGIFALLALAYGSSHGFGFDVFKKENIESTNSDKKFTQEYTQPVDDIYNITVNWNAGNITLAYYDGKEIKVTESSSSELDSDTKLTITEDSEDLTVSWNDGEKIYYQKTLPELSHKDLTIEIPNDMKLGVISFNVNESNVTTYGYTADTLSIIGKGDVNLKDITADKLTISDKNGEISLSNCTAENLKINSQQGNITAENCTAEDAKLNSIYGNISFTGSFDSMTGSSTSGDVTLSTSTKAKSISAESVNGNVSVSVPNDIDALATLKTSKGKLTSTLGEVSGKKAELTLGNPEIPTKSSGSSEESKSDETEATAEPTEEPKAQYYSIELSTDTGDISLLGLEAKTDKEEN